MALSPNIRLFAALIQGATTPEERDEAIDGLRMLADSIALSQGAVVLERDIDSELILRERNQALGQRIKALESELDRAVVLHNADIRYGNDVFRERITELEAFIRTLTGDTRHGIAARRLLR